MNAIGFYTDLSTPLCGQFVVAEEVGSPPTITDKTMFITIARPAVEPTGPDAVAVPGAPAVVNPTARALHARLLTNAALRRRRGIQRRAEARQDDADYWLKAAFAAVSKAAQTRPETAPLP